MMLLSVFVETPPDLGSLAKASDSRSYLFESFAASNTKSLIWIAPTYTYHGYRSFSHQLVRDTI